MSKSKQAGQVKPIMKKSMHLDHQSASKIDELQIVVHINF